MVRVVRSNFENSFVAFEAALKDAQFVAIDEEMTGIDLSDKQWRYSRADSAAVRYRKMAAVAERFSLIQFGVCPFVPRDGGAAAGAPFPLDATAEGAPLVAHPFGVFVFLPLCLMRDLSSLAVGSILGTAGTIYTSLFMLLRLVEFELASIVRFKIATTSRARRFRHGSSYPARRIRPTRQGSCIDESRFGGEEGA